MKNKILLLDSNSLMHRAYHAMPNLSTPQGFHTGAIYGFLNILLKLIKEQQPTHIAAAFDLKGKTFRHEMFKDYKATRKPMDAELAEQVEPLKNLITAMGIKIVSKEGYEGDDILGTLAKRFNDECIIVTGDRDSFQLVSPTTKIFWTKKGVSDIEVYDVERLKEDGFTPSQFIDYKALMGDSSDNIPGVKGIGEKTAKALLEEYGSLDEILSHSDDIKGKNGENIRRDRELALLCRTLATINTDTPVECELKDLEFTPVYKSEVRDMIRSFQFKSIEERMNFEEAEEEPQAAFKKEEITLYTAEDIKNAVKGDRIAVLIGEDIRFALDHKTEYVVAIKNNLLSDGVYFDEAIDELVRCTKDMTIICFDFKSLSKKFGFDNAKVFDVMIASHLANGSLNIKDLEQALRFENLTVGACELYYAADILHDKLAKQGLNKLFYDVETPLSRVLRNMEQRGVAVSKDKLLELGAKCDEEIERISKEIYSLAGMTFNIASPMQLGDVLFERLMLPHGKKSKKGYSVSEDVLTKLVKIHPIIQKILDYRHYAKLRSTYVYGYEPYIIDGRIHTEFTQCVTATGRLSSINPNLQNIPARSEDAKEVKSAFLPSKGNVLVSADYSQIELRLLAHFSGDEQLVSAFINGDDIHAITASQILGKPISEVTATERRDAKAVNFGIIYGISGFGLAENLAIPQRMAKAYIDNYFLTHPSVRQFMDDCVKKAKETGYAETLLGRKRFLSDINASNYMVRSSQERMAMNTPLQGSAADIIKLAMIGVEKCLENMKSKMILQIHDELIIDTDMSEVEDVKRILEEEMQNAVTLKVPLIAKAVSGSNWSELK